jgi:hypothetical protein
MIQIFINEFERFYDLLIKQIEICPAELWTASDGEYPYWQHILHTVGITELYAADISIEQKTPYGMPVLMFAEEPERVMSQDELKGLAIEIHELALTYMKGVYPDQFMEINQRLTKRLNREVTELSNLIAMIRHLCYHIGCCDTILRTHGVKGVY